jgi:hypothetical protein
MSRWRNAAVFGCALLAFSCGEVAYCQTAADSWMASPELAKRLADRIPNANFDEAKVPPYALPDPLVFRDGKKVTRENWPTRREEILELFREHMHGRAPVGKPDGMKFDVLEEDPREFDGNATRKLVAISFDTPHDGRRQFRVQLFIPNGANKSAPALVLLQFEGLTDRAAPLVVDRGWALAVMERSSLAADDKEKYRDGVINAFSGDGELAQNAWRAIAAWAWGASRVLDYLQTDSAIDAKRVVVVGFSRMGKAALWAGASDERFAGVISNESGAGGAALSKRIYGEAVRNLSDVFPHWFCDNFRQYSGNESELPVDQHLLLACVAPRPLYVGSADEDLWCDPRGEFLACVAASPVYELTGVKGLGATTMPALESPLNSGRIGYHVRSGSHGFTDYDWTKYLDFLDRELPAAEAMENASK